MRMADHDTSGTRLRLPSAWLVHSVARTRSSVRSAFRWISRAGSRSSGLGGWVCMSTLTFVATAAMAVEPPPLQPITLDQAIKAGAAGTGCSWSLPGDRRMRFVAAGDRAVVRFKGRAIVLSPAPRARELFPFTFADWRAAGMTVAVRLTGTARTRGTEVITEHATLRIVIQGTTRLMDGIISCGS